MITLLHGENIVSSRKELDIYKAKAVGKEIVVLEGNKIDKTALIEALETKSLFQNDRLCIIESLFSSKKKLDFGDLLSKNSMEDIIIWEPKEISKTTLAKLPKNTITKLFKFEKVLFKFLESFRPNNIKVILSLFNDCLKNENPELIFFMMIRQFRNLLIAKDCGGHPNSEISGWQLSRLTNQAGYFTMGELLIKYKNLLEIDTGQKTGSSVFDLKKNIELFIVSF